MEKIKIILFLVVFGLFLPSLVLANNNETFLNPEAGWTEESLEARVERILEQKEVKPENADELQLYQKLELLVTKGSLENEKIIVESGHFVLSNQPKYKIGDQLIVSYSQSPEELPTFFIVDFIRRRPLAYLFILFIVTVAVITRLKGVTAVLGMGLSFLVIFLFILPRLAKGSNPVVTAITGSLFIIPVTFLLSHGLNKKTTVAILSTFITLVISGVLAGFFVNLTKLTGFASEEAGFLQFSKGGLINIRGLLLAGIIIGLLGVLDDITISQSAIVFQLKEVNPKLRGKELYRGAMEVGKDHITSMVNTLVLVYVGAALPLLLLFIDNPHPFSEVVNYEIVADEIVRTLVGSTGLVLAVPITTLIASMVAAKR